MPTTPMEKYRERAYPSRPPHDIFIENDDSTIGVDLVTSTFGESRWVNIFVDGMHIQGTQVSWKTLYAEGLDDLITMLEFAMKTHFPDYERKSS